MFGGLDPSLIIRKTSCNKPGWVLISLFTEYIEPPAAITSYRGQPIEQPIQMTSFRIVPDRTDPTVSGTAPCSRRYVYRSYKL